MEKKQKKIIKAVLTMVVLSSAIYVSIIFLMHILIPFGLTIIKSFLSLIQIWLLYNSDIYILFFGGAFFLVVMYRIFEALASVWFKATELIARKIKEEFLKQKHKPIKGKVKKSITSSRRIRRVF